MKILVSDPIAEDGIAVLRQAGHEVDVRTGLSPDELKAIIGDYAALAVRSETKVTADILAAATSMRIIGRAGVGVDNIDLDEATRRGIIVVNAPAGNTVTTAEHSFAMLMAAARNIPQAYVSVRNGEWKRSKFIGTELSGKTLGIIGLGKVGAEVARRAVAFDMKVLAYDPYASPEIVAKLGVTLAEVDEILPRADFLTVHTPLTDATRGMIGAERLRMMKPTARVINCARGGIIDEAALAEAVEQGVIAGAALDVFTREPIAPDNPLLRSEKIILTPHLGASTEEAQVNVAVDIAQQIVEVLAGGQARYAVNLPLIAPDALRELTPFMPVAVALGQLGIQLVQGQPGTIRVDYAGDIAAWDTSLLTRYLIKGIIETISDTPVNVVNARTAAAERGLHIVEQKTDTSATYQSLVTVAIETTGGAVTVAGTVIDREPHIVAIDGYRVNVVPNDAYWLLSRNLDRPGMIGAIGTLLGEHDINVNTMQTGRERPRGEVLMLLGVDEPIPDAVLDQIRSMPDIHSAQLVRL